MADRDEILTRYLELKDRIGEAGVKWGGCEILPVTKTVDAERILVLKEAGVRAIGENRVQEAMSKLDLLGNAFEIDIIGRMQTNKAKYAARFAHCVQSMDRLELAESLEKALDKENRTMDVLIEVNIGSDPQKAGVSHEEAIGFFESLRAYPHISPIGLMTVAPIAQDAEEVRPLFRKMRALFERMRDLPGGEKFSVLSMGMSGDCLVAAQEGSTLVRVGSAIFGKRVY